MNKEMLKLRWACRRGMLELDLLLTSFIEHDYHRLSAVDKANFHHLLSCQDQELFRYFFEHITPNDRKLSKIVNLILGKTLP